MKIALCFIINYDHILNKEHIWREWIEPNKDIFNVYFYYKDLKQINSKWIMEHTIPPNYIYETSYFHVMPAYISLLKFAYNHDVANTWFCMLTDSCCPIISPKRLRYLFYKYHNYSLFSWRKAWWNPYYHKRASLANLPSELWLGHDPWFILTRENVKQSIDFVSNQKTITQTICSGGLANETFFAVVFKLLNEYDKNPSRIICESTHITDWNRPSSKTSPHLFKDANEEDIRFINTELKNNPYYIFIRKVSREFPDDILRHYIWEYNKENDEDLVLIEPIHMVLERYYNKTIKNKYNIIFGLLIICFIIYFV
jgi:hypothetical protein